jgi:hypothetical protein
MTLRVNSGWGDSPRPGQLELSMGVIPLYLNRHLSDDARRAHIFGGAVFLYSAPPESRQMVEWIRGLSVQAFQGLDDVRRAHEQLDVKAFVDRVGPLKSKFTNHAESKRLCQALISALGSDPDITYFDLPRLRVAPPGNYLTSGVSYAYKPHRDTWYAHPPQLVSFWVPVDDSEKSTVMSMYFDYFDKPIQNSTSGWDYDDWVANARYAAAQNVGTENRRHPMPAESVSDSLDIRIVQNAGDLTLFSTCHLHATAPNETGLIRYSYDLRTINIEDLQEGRGPSNVDSKATGSTLRDFLRVRDLAPLDVKATRL